MLISFVLIIKYKGRGALVVLGYLAFASIYLLIIRVFNVTITMEGIIGGIIVLILNYFINIRLININEDKKIYYKKYLDIIMKLIPIYVLSIILVFIPIMSLSSIGMMLFWGISLSLAYNVTVTRKLLSMV